MRPPSLARAEATTRREPQDMQIRCDMALDIECIASQRGLGHSRDHFPSKHGIRAITPETSIRR